MKGAICCFVFVATAFCVNSLQVDKDLQEKCIAISGITQDEMEEGRGANSTPSEKSFCYLGCLAENVNFWDDKAKESVEMIGEMDDQKMKQTIKDCFKKIPKSDKCIVGRNIHACVKEAGLLN